MSAEAGSPISTYFRVCDGERVRFADNKADSDVTVLLLAPWPESLWAFRRIWHRVSAVGRAVRERTHACRTVRGCPSKNLTPWQERPVRRPLSPEPLGRRIRLPRI
jgi:hypothetical protein